MSNGDLDGDTYFVCWDQDLIQTMHAEAFELPPPDLAPAANGNEEEKKEERIEDRLIWYFEKDLLGHVNNLHMAVCDHYLHFQGTDGPR